MSGSQDRASVAESVGRSYTPSVERRTSPWSLLDAVAQDLAGILDRGHLSRDVRPEARRLLMEAWLLQKGRRTTAGARAAVAVARRLDELVAGALAAVPDASPAAVPQPDRLRIADRLLAPRRAPIEDRVSALEASIDALARRTHRMVEGAEASARRSGILPPAFAKPSDGGGRENLELVWGDNES